METILSSTFGHPQFLSSAPLHTSWSLPPEMRVEEAEELRPRETSVLQSRHFSCHGLYTPAVSCFFYASRVLKILPQRIHPCILIQVCLASLLSPCSSRCILEIEASIKMVRWYRFLSHRPKDRGDEEARNREMRRFVNYVYFLNCHYLLLEGRQNTLILIYLQ